MSDRERAQRLLAWCAWRLYERAVREHGKDRADEMVGPVSLSLMRKFPNERGM